MHLATEVTLANWREAVRCGVCKEPFSVMSYSLHFTADALIVDHNCGPDPMTQNMVVQVWRYTKELDL